MTGLVLVVFSVQTWRCTARCLTSTVAACPKSRNRRLWSSHTDKIEVPGRPQPRGHGPGHVDLMVASAGSPPRKAGPQLPEGAQGGRTR